ncbi:MFS transporter [Flexivirga meconopsidis]|uniref:MFS transporter n=1 Tax=Flexivirga meconopsidis TaxID=2977121 RepID=UPI0022407853|nr:MFS transporter [Flexivirga meconopsidis]
MTGRAAADATPLPAAFTRFWTGETVSSFGTYVSVLALQVIVLETLHGTVGDVGWLNSARWLPYLVLGLFAGAWVERRRRQPVLVATDLAAGVLLGAIPVAWACGVLSLPLLLVVVMLFGTVTLLNGAASMAVLPRLVDRPLLQRAHARIDGSDAVAQASGPALAGVLIKVMGAPLAVVVDAASYLFSAAMMASLRVADPIPAVTGPRNLRREIADGMRWLYKGSLGPMSVSTHIWFVGNATLGVVVPAYALQVLDLQVLAFAITSAAAGVGALAGASVTTRVGRGIGTGRTIIGAHALSAVAVMVMAAAGLGSGVGATVVLGVGQLLHGCAMGLSNSHEMAYRQTVTPDHLLARTNTTGRAFNRAVVVVVAPLAGLLATAIGERDTLVVAVVAFALACAVLAGSTVRTVDLTSRTRELE